MSNPLVSVIVPVYNGERYLAEALRSVFSQDYRPLEVLVVDDGSTDGSVAVADRFPQARCIRQGRQGVTGARNTGLAAARGELIAFIDQDDLWVPGKLRLQVQHLMNHPEIDYVLAQEEIFLEPGMDKAPWWLEEHYLKQDHIAPLPGTLLARKTAFDKVGPFDPAYQIASDTDWFSRAEDAGVRKAILPNVLLKKRVHDSNLSAERTVILAETFQLLRSSVHRKRGKKAPP